MQFYLYATRSARVYVESSGVRHLVPTLVISAVFLLHQDQWFWRATHPLFLGLLPPGLWYHALYSLGCAVLMAWLVRVLWPSHLERD